MKGAMSRAVTGLGRQNVEVKHQMARRKKRKYPLLDNIVSALRPLAHWVGYKHARFWGYPLTEGDHRRTEGPLIWLPCQRQGGEGDDERRVKDRGRVGRRTEEEEARGWI